MLHIPFEHAADYVNKLFVISQSSSCCELSNPVSPECIHNSAVHDEGFTMCFMRKFKRKRLNLLTDSKEKRLLLSLLSCPRAVRAMA